MNFILGTRAQEEELPRCGVDGQCAEGRVCAAIDCFMAPCPNQGLRCIKIPDPVEPIVIGPVEPVESVTTVQPDEPQPVDDEDTSSSEEE